MIDRYLLRYFLAVVDSGNFSRAAAACGVTQPTLSIGIAKLEAEAGAKLFERSNRRVALTPAGGRFASHARRIEAEFAAALLSVSARRRRARLRLGLLASLPAAGVAAAVRAAVGDDADVELMEGRRAELAALMERGRLDAVVTLAPPGAASAALPIGSEPYALALPAAHPLAGGGPVDPRALAEEGMVIRRHCEVLAAVSAVFTGAGVRPRIAARTTNDERAVAYVRSGLGVTVMPACFAADGLALVPLAGFEAERRLVLQATPGVAEAMAARLAAALRAGLALS